MKFSIIALLLCSVAGSSFGATIYANATNDQGSTLQYVANGFSGIGDTITVAGTQRLATQATAQFFNLLDTAGTFSATLSLYEVGTGGAVVGNLLVSKTVDNIAISGFDSLNPLTTGVATVVFPNLNVTVPTNLIFLLAVSNVVNADLGVTLFDPPTVGSSSNSGFISRTGSTFAASTTGSGVDNVNFTLDATDLRGVPEPGTLLGAGMVLLVLGIARRRR